MAKSPQKNIGIIIFGVGLIALLIGLMTDIYSTTVGIIVALAIWILGMPIVKLVMGGAKKKPEEAKPSEAAPQSASEPAPEEPKVEEPEAEPPQEEQR